MGASDAQNTQSPNGSHSNRNYTVISLHTETICDAHSISGQEQNVVKILPFTPDFAQSLPPPPNRNGK